MEPNVYIFGPAFSSFVRSVMLCCEEKGISYRYGMSPKGQSIRFKSSEHRTIHPYGKVPALLHNERVLFETSTICRYLDACFAGPALQPDSILERAQLDERCAEISIYIDQTLIRDLVLEFAFPKGPEGKIRQERIDKTLPAARQTLQRLTTLLGEHPFICGQNYTIADALLTPVLDYVELLPIGKELVGTGRLQGYLNRMRARPSGMKVLNIR
ncbi:MULTISPECIES: glutathione S-transferase family protein [Oceanimonas]|uniref:Glutathione S-transferase family protein n=1 Tax=Oceanimonas smirnovii TaxID=264574 RepID=A0ABW7NX41_9GAMM|nr:glutathione S-transferase family protein [Oceanimonas sp. CAM02]MDV2857612.1 glutathione S-transferase family protein [Oceanimonas sp. CAM02]